MVSSERKKVQPILQLDYAFGISKELKIAKKEMKSSAMLEKNLPNRTKVVCISGAISMLAKDFTLRP